MTSKATVDDFLAQRTLALVGASATRKRSAATRIKS